MDYRTAFLLAMKNIRISLTLFIVTAGCSQKMEKTTPVRENITEAAYAAGIIKARSQYQVYATVSGIIKNIFISESDLVKKGEVLILLTDPSSKLNRENADLSAKFADYQTNKDKLTDLKNSINLALNKYLNDSLLFRRQQNLWNQQIGSKLELEQKDLAAQGSKMSLESAKIKYNDMQRQLELNAKQSRNNVAISRSKENDYRIKSEINGKVYFIYPKQGEIVNPLTVLAILGDASRFYIELEIDEYDIVKIKLGQKVLVTMDSYKGEVFEAKISKINPLMNERTKTFTAEASFSKQPPVLYPNLTAEANIIIKTIEKAITIPRNYLIDDSLVLVNKKEKRPVKTGIKDFQKVEIIDGLTDKEIIYKAKE